MTDKQIKQKQRNDNAHLKQNKQSKYSTKQIELKREINNEIKLDKTFFFKRDFI